MTEQSEWRFSDDRGQQSTAARTPERVLAYVQAGATLWDLGIRPVGIFGSDHDGPDPDTAKTGTLPLGEVAYVGAGAALDVERLLSTGPDLVVAVSYGGGHVYGLTPETAKPLEERVPVVVLDVSQARTFGEIGDRFADLARSLSARPGPARTGIWTPPGSGCAPWSPPRPATRPGCSPSPRQARTRHMSRAQDVARAARAHRAGRPGRGQGRGPRGQLVHAEPLRHLRAAPRGDPDRHPRPRGPAGRAAGDCEGAPTPVVPWNPEPLYGPRDHARFLGLVADALEAARAS